MTTVHNSSTPSMSHSSYTEPNGDHDDENTTTTPNEKHHQGDHTSDDPAGNSEKAVEAPIDNSSSHTEDALPSEEWVSSGSTYSARPRLLLNTMNTDENSKGSYHDNAIPTASSSLVDTPMSDTGDGNFEEIMRERNKVRKEREEYHMAALKVQIGRLEDALAAETKRRVDATTALDDMARTQVFEMEQRLKQQLEQEHKGLQERLDSLEERVHALEQKWTKDSHDHVELVQNKAADLTKGLQDIQQQQDAERKARLKREGNLLQQVEQHAKEFEERWKEEQHDRVQKMGELEDKIVRQEARLAMEQKRYEERIESELKLLKQELADEMDERQAQDEEIVAALNRYTQQLQQSLSILSSD